MSNEFKQILKESNLPTTENAIREKFENITKEEGLITNTSSVSPFWRLITAIAIGPVKWLMDFYANEMLPNLFLKAATGKWLDIHAWKYDIKRRPAQETEGNILFVKEDIGASVTIPAETIVQTERLDKHIYRLKIKEEVTIEGGVPSMLIPFVAELTGDSYNLDKGYYRILTTPIPGISHIENGRNWITKLGTKEETDEDLRLRCQIQFSNVGRHHIDNVYRKILAETTGISFENLYFEHGAPRGPGTANCYLLADTGTLSDEIINKANSEIHDKGWHGLGDDLICYPMPEIQVNVSCELCFDNIINDDAKEKIKTNVEHIIRCAFRENDLFDVTKTTPYKRFSFSKLGEEIHIMHPEIKSIIWKQADIINKLNVPRLESLNVEIFENV